MELVSGGLSQQFLQAPDMIRDSRRHRGSHAEGAVNPAEIVVGEVQGQGRLEVRQYFRERVGQPGEPPAQALPVLDFRNRPSPS